ncbi:MAG TPA: hypothetical protein VH438_11595 [Gemmatimonadales bacterium]|jgi:hypothetical protein
MRDLGLAFLFISSAGLLRAQDSAYAPSFEPPKATQLVAVYIGSSTCGPCQSPELKAAIEQVKQGLRTKTTAAGQSFTAIGVAMDWSVEEGYDFLRKSGEWDEVVTGSNWINLGALRYIWADSTALSAMPQLVVVRRDIDWGKTQIDLTKERILLRLMGAPEIESWIRRGFPLPSVE